ncbi:2491_t:CDS:2, partial [Gigaspora rosea]
VSLWLLSNLVMSFNVVCRHNHFHKLYDHILKFTFRNPYSLFNSSDLPLLDELNTSAFIKTKIPPRRCLRLMTNENKAIISSWIDEKDKDYYTCITNPYKFKLLLRGSRDGFDVNIFHRLCDFQGPTIVIIKTVQDDLVGGYNLESYFSTTSDTVVYFFIYDQSNPVLSRLDYLLGTYEHEITNSNHLIAEEFDAYNSIDE